MVTWWSAQSIRIVHFTLKDSVTSSYGSPCCQQAQLVAARAETTTAVVAKTGPFTLTHLCDVLYVGSVMTREDLLFCCRACPQRVQDVVYTADHEKLVATSLGLRILKVFPRLMILTKGGSNTWGHVAIERACVVPHETLFEYVPCPPEHCLNF